MSVSGRKLGWYSLSFFDYDSDDEAFDKDLLLEFLKYLKRLPEAERIINDERQNKATSFDSIRIVGGKDNPFIKVIFKSCKYNHSPNYMSSRDGSERPSPKSLVEGEKEKTHMGMRLDDEEAVILLEQRRSGITMSGIARYFDAKIYQFMRIKGVNKDFYIRHSVIPPEGFLEALEKTRRISIADVYVDKSILGSDFFQLTGRDRTQYKDDLVLQIKPKRSKTLNKRDASDIFRKVTSGGTKIRRIRLHCQDENLMDVILDSDMNKSFRANLVNVDLDQQGIVESKSIFSKIEEMLEVSDEE